MTALLVFSETNAGPVVTDALANLNFGSSDTPNLVPASAPITIPPSGTAYSYEKYWRVKWQSGAGNQVDNLKLWKQSGAYQTGESIFFNCVENVRQNDAFATPVQTQSTKADVAMATSVPTLQNVFTPQATGGNLRLNAIGDYTDYIVVQLALASTASPGSANQKVFRFQYDEQ
jgi:hypothetical protein